MKKWRERIHLLVEDAAKDLDLQSQAVDLYYVFLSCAEVKEFLAGDELQSPDFYEHTFTDKNLPFDVTLQLPYDDEDSMTTVSGAYAPGNNSMLIHVASPKIAAAALTDNIPVFKSTFIHEATHALDNARNNELSSNKPYFTQPAELNARFHQMLASFLDKIKAYYDDLDVKTFFTKTLTNLAAETLAEYVDTGAIYFIPTPMRKRLISRLLAAGMEYLIQKGFTAETQPASNDNDKPNALAGWLSGGSYAGHEEADRDSVEKMGKLITGINRTIRQLKGIARSAEDEDKLHEIEKLIKEAHNMKNYIYALREPGSAVVYAAEHERLNNFYGRLMRNTSKLDLTTGKLTTAKRSRICDTWAASAQFFLQVAEATENEEVLEQLEKLEMDDPDLINYTFADIYAIQSDKQFIKEILYISDKLEEVNFELL